MSATHLKSIPLNGQEENELYKTGVWLLILRAAFEGTEKSQVEKTSFRKKQLLHGNKTNIWTKILSLSPFHYLEDWGHNTRRLSLGSIISSSFHVIMAVGYVGIIASLIWSVLYCHLELVRMYPSGQVKDILPPLYVSAR